jgi:hypothetical protein
MKKSDLTVALFIELSETSTIRDVQVKCDEVYVVVH